MYIPLLRSHYVFIRHYDRHDQYLDITSESRESEFISYFLGMMGDSPIFLSLSTLWGH